MSLAVCGALAGLRVILVDLDPRAAATKWAGVRPAEEWQHSGAILGNAEPHGWADDLALPVPWERVPELRIVPAARQLSNREKTAEEYADMRLRMALDGVPADLAVLDLPNRQGGPIVQNALAAASQVLYATKLDEDGLDGVDGAHTSVNRFIRHRQSMGAPVTLSSAGVVAGMVRDTVMARDARRAWEELRASYPDELLTPWIPERVIVREARAAGDYYGFYPAGKPVHEAYMEITRKVLG